MWQKIKDWFSDSETIFWARLQLVAGIVWGVLVTVDLSPLLDSKWLTLWLIASGIITELARRSRENDL